MKILHVITRMVHGGAQINTLMCAIEQARRGHDVTLVTGTETGPEGSLLGQARAAPIRLIELPALVRSPQPFHDLRALQALYHLLGERFDVLHTHTSKAGIVGRVAGWLRRVPVVVHTPHGHVFHGYFNPLREKIFTWIERLVAPMCHKMVMLTRGDLQDHIDQKLAPPDRFCIIPSGVDLSHFSAEKLSPESCALPSGKVLIGTVVRLVAVKGIFDLVEAFALVHETRKDCQLVIAGHGPLRVELEQRIVGLGLEAAVTLLGHVDPVGPLLQALEIFVLASHNEGMGRVVVEAMASGLPIVATRIGGLPDLVEEGVNGLLVEPRNPTSLAQAILTLVGDPDTVASMGEKSLARSHEFSDRVMYDGLEALYRELWLRAGKT
jgi:glycosyltransferase involved in cell wall biosynthesis